jgi:hypothetical protein
MSVLGENDGWHFVPGSDKQHYFYREYTLCGLAITDGSHHDNDPTLHCDKCTQTLRKLMLVASSIAGKKLSPEEVLNLIANLDKIINSQGMVDKVRTPENVIAVIGKPDGKTKTMESGYKRKKIDSGQS